MIRRISIQGALLALPFTSLIGLFMVLGIFRNAPALVNQSDHCRLPCWNSITPQQTPLDTAEQILIGAGYEIRTEATYQTLSTTAHYYHPSQSEIGACNVMLGHENGLVTMITLTECQGAQLGDVISLLGSPQEIMMPWTNFALINIVHREMLANPLMPAVTSVTALAFFNRSALVTANPCEMELSPQTEVLSIHFDPSLSQLIESSASEAQELLSWHGFVPYWRYQQLHPNARSC